MVTYRRGFRGCLCFFSKIFRLRGSVFPSSFCVAFPCAAATAGVRVCIERGYLEVLGHNDQSGILTDNACWSGFLFLVGFLIVFRTSQAYARFWDGCTHTCQMRAEWFDACSALVAFCKYSKASSESVLSFKHLLVRLFSMLHAVALADIEDSNSDDVEVVAAFKYELLDAGSIDVMSLMAVKESDTKVELVFQWIQQLIVENIDSGVLNIPAPILSRSFHELANGMVAFHDAIKISTIPFPFPYAQTCECLLFMHWIVTPLVVSQWVSTPWWGAVFSFMQVFVYWCLNAIAVEIENPFGMDPNDIDAESMQGEFNRQLQQLMEPRTLRTPRLCHDMAAHLTGRSDCAMRTAFRMSSRRESLSEVWTSIDTRASASDPPARTVRSRRPSTSSNRSARSARSSGTVVGAANEQRPSILAQSRRSSGSSAASDVVQLPPSACVKFVASEPYHGTGPFSRWSGETQGEGRANGVHEADTILMAIEAAEARSRRLPRIPSGMISTDTAMQERDSEEVLAERVLASTAGVRIGGPADTVRGDLPRVVASRALEPLRASSPLRKELTLEIPSPRMPTG